jgi:hypothetical protein
MSITATIAIAIAVVTVSKQVAAESSCSYSAYVQFLLAEMESSTAKFVRLLRNHSEKFH